MSNSTRFLLIHQGALGDFILALPVVESLSTKFPEANFTIVANSSNLSLIKSRPYLKRALSKDLACFAPLFSEKPFDVEKVSRILGGTFDRAFIFGQSKLPVLARNVSVLGIRKVYEVCSFPLEKQRVPVTEFIYSQLFERGLDLPKRKAVIAPDPAEKEEGTRYAEELLSIFDAIALIHPGSGSPRKLWPLKYWKAVLGFLGNYEKIVKVVLCGPADKEIIKRLKLDGCPGNVRLIRDWSLPGIVGLMERASFFIGNDSGITHLAAAVGIPTTAVFGETDPLVWGPSGENVKIFKTEWRYPENLELPSGFSEIEIPEDVLAFIKATGCSGNIV